jgi:hypothetical protein
VLEVVPAFRRGTRRVNCGSGSFPPAPLDVGFTTTFRDSRAASVRTYTNPDLTAAPPVQDSSASSCSGGSDQPGSLLAGAGCGGRVQAVDVAFRVLEHGPASPGLGPRLLGELHAALLELLGGLVDVVDLEDDAAEAADLLRLVGKAQ